MKFNKTKKQLALTDKKVVEKYYLCIKKEIIIII